MPILKPKLFTTLQGYRREQFMADAVAGMTVGVVALPLAIAFAIASGVSPERGLFTAVIAGLIISVLGGSRVQIGGPTGAFVVIVAGIVQQYGLDGLQIATLMAGVILIFMGIARFGSAIKFIPYPVVVGFTSGIALIIFSSQIKDALGLPLGDVPADFVHQWGLYVPHFGAANPAAMAVCAGSLAVMIGWQRVTKRLPGSLIALVLATVAVQLFNLPVETVGSRFGDIPHLLPRPSLPHVDMEMVRSLVPSATTIALLAGIEALLSAVVADGMIGGRHRSNMELVAQGVANICSPLFGGIPATGAIARTAANVNSGGRTPVSGIIHALTLLLIMLFFGQWARLIPLPCLAAVLMVVAYNMSEWHSFLMVLKSPRSDVIVLLTTFGLTVLVNLTAAIEVGMVLAAFLFIRRMAQVTNIGDVTREFIDEEEPEDPNAISTRQVPRGVQVYEINGPFFFGASHTFREAMRIISPPPKAIVLRMRHVLAIDASGLYALKEQHRSAVRQHSVLILSDVHAQPLIALERSGLLVQIGEQNVFGNIDDALNRARQVLSLPPLERPASFTPTVRRETANPQPHDPRHRG
ncbi:MAG: sodium-independent anion transporter [Candidatus Omnitrophica bacterium CG11_big_fil_rev_8_21_14_0_20_63_9]|nr:MAG: sodium-independent anion transporter [Candidatus Omnitrophica bacterium CG11_big_fil_rev_8_21_14_0_20_63_9]